MNIRRMNRRVWSIEPSTRRVAFAWLVCWIVALSGLQLQSLSLEAHGDEAPAGGKKLVVVAPSEFQASLAEFLAHKAKQLPTEWVALEEVLKGQTGVDDPEKLKRFLFQRWRDDHLGYALLVGDVDVMPVRYMVLDPVSGAIPAVSPAPRRCWLDLPEPWQVPKSRVWAMPGPTPYGTITQSSGWRNSIPRPIGIRRAFSSKG